MTNNVFDLNRNKIGLRIAIFTVGLCLFLTIFDYLSYYEKTAGYINKLTCTNGSRYGSEEVELAMSAMQKQDSSRALIIGDSVAGQIFGGLVGVNENYNIFPVNRAMTFAGQYILLKIYLDNHPDAQEIYIAFYPGTLSSAIDEELSYQYVAMPFIENGYGDELDGSTIEDLKDIYGSFFLKPEVLHYIDYSGLNRKLYLNAVSKSQSVSIKKTTDDSEAGILSDTSIVYLKKINSLCKERNVEIHLISTPVADTAERHEEYDRIKEEFHQYELDELYPGYIESFMFYPEEMFLDDKVHFKPEYKNRETMNPIIIKMSETSDEYSSLSGCM